MWRFVLSNVCRKQAKMFVSSYTTIRSDLPPRMRTAMCKGVQLTVSRTERQGSMFVSSRPSDQSGTYIRLARSLSPVSAARQLP